MIPTGSAFILWLIIMAIPPCVAIYLAMNRNRHILYWAVACFLMPLTILVLWKLPIINKN